MVRLICLLIGFVSLVCGCNRDIIATTLELGAQGATNHFETEAAILKQKSKRSEWESEKLRQQSIGQRKVMLLQTKEFFGLVKKSIEEIKSDKTAVDRKQKLILWCNQTLLGFIDMSKQAEKMYISSCSLYGSHDENSTLMYEILEHQNKIILYIKENLPNK